MGDADSIIEALHAGQAQLEPVIEKLTKTQLTTPTFPGEWDVSQVVSHLGSGALITRNTIDAALTGHPDPGPEANQEIWAVWDAMGPVERRDAYTGANEQLLALLDSIDESARESVRSALAFRLSEFAFHSWDIRAVQDDDAVVELTAVPHLLELIPTLLPFAVKLEALGRKAALGVTLTDPGREFTLSLTDRAELGTTEPTDGSLALPAEAWLRLATGRLRPEYTPATVTLTGPVSLDDLRRAFPGY